MIELSLVNDIAVFYEEHKDLINEEYHKEYESYTNDRTFDLDIKLFQQLIDAETLLLFEIYLEDTFIGYVNLMLSPSLLNKGKVEACIDHIVIDKDNRGKGLGKELLENIEGLLINEGVDELKLAIPSTEAHDAFAESLGYEKAITTHIKRLK